MSITVAEEEAVSETVPDYQRPVRSDERGCIAQEEAQGFPVYALSFRGYCPYGLDLSIAFQLLPERYDASIDICSGYRVVHIVYAVSVDKPQKLCSGSGRHLSAINPYYYLFHALMIAEDRG